MTILMDILGNLMVTREESVESIGHLHQIRHCGCSTIISLFCKCIVKIVLKFALIKEARGRTIVLLSSSTI